MSDQKDSDRKRSNPWGGGSNNGSGNQRPPQGPWRPQNNNSGGGKPPQDLDDLLRGLQKAMPGNMGGGSVVFGAAGLLFLLWMASGIYIINPGEHGVIQRFGAWSHTKTEEGLGYHFPAPIETLTKVNVSEVRRMEIGFAENAATSDLYSTQRTALSESLMLTSDRNIIDLQMSIQWDIKSAEDYLFNIQDQEATIKKVAESAIREVVGQTPMFKVITSERTEIAARAKTIIQENLDEYNSGVNVRLVLIQKAAVHPDVQNAFQDVQSAKQDAQDTQNQAEANREAILPEARGQATKILREAEAYKQSQIAKANGDAERFKAIYSAYLNGKDVTKERLYIEAMEGIFKNAQKVIVDNKGSGVVPYLPLGALDSKAATPAKPSEGGLKQ